MPCRAIFSRRAVESALLASCHSNCVMHDSVSLNQGSLVAKLPFTNQAPYLL